MGIGSQVHSFLYVDDSKLIKCIEKEDDVGTFQNEIEEFYQWARSNNMSFNGDKFVILRYGRNTEIKDNTNYFTDNWETTVNQLTNTRIWVYT